MTHDEYLIFLKKNTSRIYDKKDNYWFKQYHEDADKIEILNFDLSDFNI